VGVTAGIGFTIGSIFALPASTPILMRLILPLLAVVLSVVCLILQIWSGAALVTAANGDGKISLLDSYSFSVKKLAAYVWTGILGIGIVTASFVFFIIPGIVVSVWFILATVLVITENKRGLDALFTSKELVKNHWRQTALFLAWVMAIILFCSYAVTVFKLPVETWSIFINTMSGAFYATSLVALYRQLTAQGTVTPVTSKKRRQLYTLLVLIGIASIIVITSTTVVFALKYKNDATRIIDASEIQQALVKYHQKKSVYPQTLSQLVPAYLPAVPADPASREPFGYASTDGGKDYALIIDYDNLGVQALTSGTGPVPENK
jgi:hypothetical protein